MNADLGGASAHSFFLDRTQHVECRRLRRTNEAGAAAMGTRLRGRLDKRRTQPLTRHLQQAERADPADLNARAVVLQRLLYPTPDRPLLPLLLHVAASHSNQPV